jgi:hypothetical protein
MVVYVMSEMFFLIDLLSLISALHLLSHFLTRILFLSPQSIRMRCSAMNLQ